MKIVTAYFHRQDNYKKLLDVFLRSAARVMPGVQIETVNIEVPPGKYTRDQKYNHHMDTYFAFMAKTKAALKYVDPVCVSDNDIMFRQSVEDVWEFDFDIAVTTRDHKCGLNSGVFFSRSTPAAKDFITAWLAHTREIAIRFDHDHISKHAGIDQAALFQTLEENKTAKILFLPCLIWNAEQTCWKNITPETRVIHIKSGLRDIIFRKHRLNKKNNYLIPIIKEIQQYDNTERSITVHRAPAVRPQQPNQRFYRRYK